MSEQDDTGAGGAGTPPAGGPPPWGSGPPPGGPPQGGPWTGGPPPGWTPPPGFGGAPMPVAQFCRNCGVRVAPMAVGCPNCGIPPTAGYNYCWNCAAPSQPGGVMCTNCGAQLQNPNLDPNAKSKLVAGLLGIFLGGFGVHRFYLGFTTIGVVQILVTLVTCGIGSVWGLIEGILILVGNMNTDAQGRPLKD